MGSETEEESKHSESKNQSQSETSGSENECEESGPRKKRKRQGRKAKEETGTGSDKENESTSQTLEQMESEPLNGKITNKSLKGRKQSNSEQESVDEPTKRTLRSKAGDSKKIENLPAEKDKTEPDCDDSATDSNSEDLRKRSLRSSTESQQETGCDVEKTKDLQEKDDLTVDKKRKAA